MSLLEVDQYCTYTTMGTDFIMKVESKSDLTFQSLQSVK